MDLHGLRPLRDYRIFFRFLVVVALAFVSAWVSSSIHPARTAERPAKPKSAPHQESCLVSPFHELVITDLSVVEDSRTQNGGPWSFEHLVSNICPAEQSPSDFVEQFFANWTASTSQNAKDFFDSDTPRDATPEAAAIRTQLITNWLNAWPRTSAGDLDLSRAPLRLNAIVNRIDLGEGRFAFGFLQPNGASTNCSLILEYTLPTVGPAGETQDWNWWAHQWHRLSSLQIGSAEYLNALEQITQRFTDRDLMPSRPNGSALGQVRTVEQIGVGIGQFEEARPTWELREFHLDRQTGQLIPARCAQTPHLDYDIWTEGEAPSEMFIGALVNSLLDNSAAILANSYDWDQQNEIVMAISAPAPSPLFHWLGPTPAPEGSPAADWNSLKQAFGQQTCNGCHAGNGSGIEARHLIAHAFNHISNREAGEESTLSRFLCGDILNNRIPNVLSYVCPDNPIAVRLNPRRRPVH